MLEKMVCVLVLLQGAGAAMAASAQAPMMYLMQQDITVDGTPGQSRQTSINAVELEEGSGGRTLSSRVLWATHSGFGQSGSTLDMDADDPDQQLMLAVLKSGFVMQFAPDGSLTETRAKDAKAWQALTDARPALAESLQPNSQQSQSLQPMALPATLHVGQLLEQRHAAPGQGEIIARQWVRVLTDEVAVLDLELRSTHVHGEGRQAVRRSDGMPLDMRMQLEHSARDGMPASTRTLHLLKLGAEVGVEMAVDTDIQQSYQQSLRETLASPPYSAPSSDPQDYQLQPLTDGALEPWMLSQQTLDRFEKTLIFAAVDEDGQARPRIALGGEIGPRQPHSSDGRWSPQMLTATINAATLQDAAHQAIGALPAQLAIRRVLGAEYWRSNEDAADFPFRVPVDATAAQLQSIQTIQLQADVDVYHWGGSEAVAQGAQSRDNPLLQVVWTSPRRVSVQQPLPAAGVREGLWSVAVAVDAQGRQIPIATIAFGRQLQAPGAPGDSNVLPLGWENQQAGWRQEIASAQPIVALKLLHYRWELQPRQWTFRNARDLQPEDVSLGR